MQFSELLELKNEIGLKEFKEIQMKAFVEESENVVEESENEFESSTSKRTRTGSKKFSLYYYLYHFKPNNLLLGIYNYGNFK